MDQLDLNDLYRIFQQEQNTLLFMSTWKKIKTS